MILLDTNVISEGTRSQPDANVKKWLDAQRPADLFLCTPVLAELHYGVALLPEGRRRTHFELGLRRLEEAFADRMLTFDFAAARAYGLIVAQRDDNGRSTGTMDAMIAAIAKVHGAAVATRDIGEFSDVGLDVINPFTVLSSRSQA